MNTPQVPKTFEYCDCDIRTVDMEGVPWFVAKDIAVVLGYVRPKDAIAQHCKGAVKRRLPTNGGDQEITIIPERDLYRLIMRSKLPSAERFEEWVVAEVLPAIRKSGKYGVVVQVPQSLPEALRLAADLAERVEAQGRAMIEMQPKVEAYNAFLGTNGGINLSEFAKVLKLGPRNFIDSLRHHGLLFKRNKYNLPIQLYINKGWFRVREVTAQGRLVSQTLVTPKGQEEIRGLLMKKGYEIEYSN